MRPQRYRGPPATLGSSLGAGVRIIVTCRSCGREAEPDLADQVARHGAALPLCEWAARLLCRCGARDADFVVTGTSRQNRPQDLGG